MPNGTPTGSGIQGDPYIVMDAQDFNFLRTKIGSSGAYTHVELGADIDMSVYASFTAISSAYFNIDGKNKRIYNLKINVSDSSAVGIVGYLYTQYVKDLTIEGEVTGNYNYTYDMGMLAGKLNLANGNITNVKCFGTLYANNVPQNIGGIAGSCVTQLLPAESR